MTRRRAVWILAVVVGVGAAVAAVWFIWLPQYRPGLHEAEVYGIDVSRHQADIDWTDVAGDGIEFAYIKATEGGDWVDPQFASNWEGAAAAGIDRGAYHFFTLCRPGTEQAENFLATAAGSAELPPAVDLELAGNCGDRPPSHDVFAELDDFLRLVETETGAEVVLYVGDDWEERYPVRDRLDRPLWHRRILRRPDRDDWWIWQFTGAAHVDGIDGDVDLNVMRRDAAAGAVTSSAAAAATVPATSPHATPSSTSTTTSTAAPPPAWVVGAEPLPLRPDGLGEILPTPEPLIDRRLPTAPLLPPPADDTYVSTVTPLDDATVARMGRTLRPGCPVARDDLRLVTVTFWGFDGGHHTGELVVHRDVAHDVAWVFGRLHAARFPLEEVRLITDADLDAPPTGDGNTTAALVCRSVRGGSTPSAHASGLAIDINPFHNPYVRGDVVLPERASAYLDRAHHRPGMIQPGDAVTEAFAAIGWHWGGAWSSPDLMHFSATGR